MDENIIMENEIKERASSVEKMFPGVNRNFFNKGEGSKDTKLKVHRSYFHPILNYFPESWTITTADVSGFISFFFTILKNTGTFHSSKVFTCLNTPPNNSSCLKIYFMYRREPRELSPVFC